MRVLVVGGAGYLGGALTDLLLASGHDVRVYDSLVYEECYRKDVPFILGDVRDADRLSPLLGWADVVVWLAAVVGDGACACNPATTLAVNYDAVAGLAERFDGRVIFTSTCSVYGAQDDLLTEDSPTNPLSLYASTKLGAETLLASRDAVILRLGTLYGLGDHWSRIRLDLVVNTLTSMAVSTGRLRVFGGDQWRPHLHVRDAARAILGALTGDATGVFNLVGENARIIDVAEYVASEVPGTVLDIVDTTFEDARNYRASGARARDVLGFVPSLTVGQGVAEVRRLLESGRVKDLSNPRYTNQGFLSRAS